MFEIIHSLVIQLDSENSFQNKKLDDILDIVQLINKKLSD